MQQTADQLILQEHIDSSLIRNRCEEVLENWTRLKKLATAKIGDLGESRKLFQFLRDAEEVKALSGHFSASNLFGAGLISKVAQGSRKVPSSRLGQVDFPVEQVTFHVHLSDRGPEKSFVNQVIKKRQENTCLGQAKFESYLSEGQVRIQFFFELCNSRRNSIKRG